MDYNKGYPHEQPQPPMSQSPYPPSYDQINQPAGYPPPQPYPQPQYAGAQPYPPQPMPFPGSQPYPTQTATVIVAPQVGPEPSMITCPSCRNTVVTRLEYESTMKTHLIAILLCVFGCWPCVCLPYCMDSCRNANHYCPSCGSFIGVYSS